MGSVKKPTAASVKADTTAMAPPLPGCGLPRSREGWAFVVYQPQVAEPHAKHGPTVLLRTAPGYCGAQRYSNNNAELEAIGRAAQHLAAHAPAGSVAVIHTDSEYARRAVLAATHPKKNTVLVKWARNQLRRARQKGRRLHLEHVRAHQGVEGNERADAEAKRGAALAQPPPA